MPVRAVGRRKAGALERHTGEVDNEPPSVMQRQLVTILGYATSLWNVRVAKLQARLVS